MCYSSVHESQTVHFTIKRYRDDTLPTTHSSGHHHDSVTLSCSPCPRVQLLLRRGVVRHTKWVPLEESGSGGRTREWSPRSGRADFASSVPTPCRWSDGGRSTSRFVAAVDQGDLAETLISSVDAGVPGLTLSGEMDQKRDASTGQRRHGMYELTTKWRLLGQRRQL